MASAAAKITKDDEEMDLDELVAKVHLLEHPVVLHKMTQLRRRETSSKHFRELMRELTMYLGYEATKSLQTKPCGVETPVGPYAGHEISTEVALVPVLRSGLGMTEAMLDVLPNSQVLHIGMYREKDSEVPTLYYNKLPRECRIDCAIVLEPMIATSATINAVVEILKEWGAPSVHVVSLVASRKGLSNLLQAHPDVKVHIAAIDDGLSEDGYIIPGLGDVGDRLFDTRAEPKPADAAASADADSAKKRKTTT